MRMIQIILLLATTANAGFPGETPSSPGSQSQDSLEIDPTSVPEKGKDIVRIPVLQLDNIHSVCVEVGDEVPESSDDHIAELPEDDIAEVSEDDKGFCATIFSRDSWKKMFSTTEETPKHLRRSFSCLAWGCLGLAVLVPYFRHHGLDMMNAGLVETISGCLATHPVWSKTWGTIGSSFGVFALWNLWKADLKDIANAGTKDADTPDPKSWATKTSKGCAKTLTGVSLSGLTVGSIGQLGVLWFPIGGALSTLHKRFMPVFFIPTAVGMVFYTWLSQKKTGCMGNPRRVWRTWLYGFLAILVLIFAGSFNFIKAHKNQMKMTVPDCVLENPDHREICEAEQSILPMDSKYGNCRPQVPNYGVPRKKQCDVDLDAFATFDEATKACKATVYSEEGKPDEPCFPTTTQQGGWYKNIGVCENKIKNLRGPDDPCRAASARNSEGKIDDDSFERNCGAITNDADEKVCDYEPASTSELAWTWFSVLEMVSFSSALIYFSFVLTGPCGAST